MLIDLKNNGHRRLGGKGFALVISLLVSALLPLTLLAQEPTPEQIDQLVARAMERFNTPGMAVGVVKDGELVYSKGYGVRDIRQPDAVDADTIFQIASLTKAFTAAALGILVDEGKITWEDPVIDHLPDFRMYDPWVTREFTIRDLLTHRSGLGLGAGDLLMWPEAKSTREEILQAMRHLKPVTSFRTAYAYDNLLYIIAGEVVGKVSGIPWEDFVEQRIMQPLGMTECRALPGRVDANPNRATPHMLVDGKLQTTFFGGDGPVSAAGAVNCNVSGMTKWAAMHLAGGALPDGKQLITEATQKELWTPVTLIPVSDMDRERGRTHFSTYALGWGLKDFHGYLFVSHSGGLQGMVTRLAILPEKNLAVIALSNQWNRAPYAVADGLINAFITENPEDWVEIYASAAAERGDEAAQVVADAFANRNTDSKPSLPLGAYAGTYRDPWYGDVTVERSAEGLNMLFSRSELLRGPLEHFQYDTFVARWPDRSLFGDAYATFVLGADGTVAEIKMKMLSPDTDFSFDYHDLELRRVAED